MHQLAAELLLHRHDLSLLVAEGQVAIAGAHLVHHASVGQLIEKLHQDETSNARNKRGCCVLVACKGCWDVQGPACTGSSSLDGAC